ncbi:conserved hypothetical protein [Planktothrix sp. PCC 11201]|uniref:hypothetical protein n=1 Tax=Planktothrix sp. PCC 11201 TaxID=1729650 RepID=UPI00091E8DB2|nr:hypothetical protein [Planktothrix sp. PCC 11201]SKB14202.1 conserved hypothetical protein [Planktothrix sp. PCC 11201]
MEIPQILQFVDESVYTQTGKHLNDLQGKIVRGILNRQKYADVAETYGYSEKHVKKVSHELLQMLSDVFGEQVKKSNLESVLERQINVNITLGNKNTRNNNTVSIASINICPVPSSVSSDETQTETIDKLRKFGLSDEQIAEALNLSLSLEDLKQNMI